MVVTDSYSDYLIAHGLQHRRRELPFVPPDSPQHDKVKAVAKNVMIMVRNNYRYLHRCFGDLTYQVENIH